MRSTTKHHRDSFIDGLTRSVVDSVHALHLFNPKKIHGGSKKSKRHGSKSKSKKHGSKRTSKSMRRKSFRR